MPHEGSSRCQGMDSNASKPQLQGLEPIFQCKILDTEHHGVTPEHHFHEFHVNTGPDPEDLLDDVEGLPGSLDVEDLDNEDGEVDEQGRYSELDSEAHNVPGEERPGKEREAPLQPVAKQALEDLEILLQPARKSGRGYIDPELDSFVRNRMEGMRMMLNFYTNEQSLTYDAWIASSVQVSMGFGKELNCARRLRHLTRQFIKDRTVLPVNPYGDWNESMLVDEDLCNDINLYLQEIGKEISAKKLMDFLSREDIRSKHGIEKQSVNALLGDI